MLINIYNTKDHTYMTLNLIKFGFKDVSILFEVSGEDLKELSKSNQKIFNEIFYKQVFKATPDFLLKIYGDLKNGKIKNNDLFIFEHDEYLHYLPITLQTFVMLEGLASVMINQDTISISQRSLTLLNNE